MTNNLPRFKFAPVVELVLGVQFDALSGLNSLQIGQWWKEKGGEFPISQEQDPLPPIVEPLDLSKPVEFKFRISNQRPSSRWWFLNQNQTQLLQIQEDRFIFNWRKQENESYPHFEEVVKVFEKNYSGMLEFLHANKQGAVVPNMCELTYVNHIPLDDNNVEINDVLCSYSPTQSETFLPISESVSMNNTYLMSDSAGKPIGRFRAQASTVPGPKARTIVLHLSSVGKPASPDIHGVMNFLKTAHVWGVRGFAALTTERMHKKWGRYQ